MFTRESITNKERRWRYKEALKAGATTEQARRMRDLREKIFCRHLDNLDQKRKYGEESDNGL